MTEVFTNMANFLFVHRGNWSICLISIHQSLLLPLWTRMSDWLMKSYSFFTHSFLDHSKAQAAFLGLAPLGGLPNAPTSEYSPLPSWGAGSLQEKWAKRQCTQTVFWATQGHVWQDGWCRCTCGRLGCTRAVLWAHSPSVRCPRLTDVTATQASPGH